jgi:hypothetical protein
VIRFAKINLHVQEIKIKVKKAQEVEIRNVKIYALNWSTV